MRNRLVPVWVTPSLLAVGLLAAASGMTQFGVVAVLGDVAVAFGEASADEAANQIGLSATVLGVGLAVVRLAGAASLVGASLADRLGRRRVLIATTALGMVLTGVAAGMPTFWTFIVFVALARPLLSTTNAISIVMGAEEVTARQRPLALAFMGAAYGLGTGAVPLLRAISDLGFRQVLAITAVPVVLVPVIARFVDEPSVAEARLDPDRATLGRVPPEHRRHLVILCVLIGLIAVGTGPAFTYLYVYGEQVLGMSSAAMFRVIFLAGPTGGLGLLLGSWASNRIGRRRTAALATIGAVLLVIVAYSGSTGAFIGGYLVGITVSSAFGPASGSILNELFPTQHRATANGWAALSGVVGAVVGLLVFGQLTDLMGSYGAATRLLMLPLLPVTALWFLLPETTDVELDAVDAVAEITS